MRVEIEDLLGELEKSKYTQARRTEGASTMILVPKKPSKLAAKRESKKVSETCDNLSPYRYICRDDCKQSYLAVFETLTMTS